MATGQLAAKKRPEKSALAKQQERRIWRTAYLYILPAALLMLLITFWPLIYQLWMSFTEFSNRNLRTDNLFLQIVGSFTGDLAAHNSPAFVGLRNYLTILTGDLGRVLAGFDFWRILLFNLVWTFINLFFHIAIGIGVAVLLNQDGLKFKRFYRSLYIIPWAMPGLVTAMIWRNMFDDQSGAVNQLVRMFGLEGKTRWLQQLDAPVKWIPPFVRVPDGANPWLFLFMLVLLLIIPFFFKKVRERWLPFLIGWVVVLELFFMMALPAILNTAGKPVETFGLGSLWPLSFFAVLLTNIWLGWPFMMAIATGALQSIPREMYEAAEVDGGTGWQQFWAITAPMIRPAMVPAAIVGLTLTFNQFNVIYFVSGGGPLHQTEILVTQAYRLVNETTVNLPGIGNARPYGIAASFAYIVFLVLATITLITNRITRATESYSD
jgi:arabinogalactan oligomer / maltooligosaccharide transport system permease protein